MGKEKKFQVPVLRIAPLCHWIAVVAKNRKEAMRKALEQAPNMDFHACATAGDTEYEVDEVEEMP